MGLPGNHGAPLWANLWPGVFRLTGNAHDLECPGVLRPQQFRPRRFAAKCPPLAGCGTMLRKAVITLAVFAQASLAVGRDGLVLCIRNDGLTCIKFAWERCSCCPEQVPACLIVARGEPGGSPCACCTAKPAKGQPDQWQPGQKLPVALDHKKCDACQEVSLAISLVQIRPEATQQAVSDRHELVAPSARSGDHVLAAATGTLFDWRLKAPWPVLPAHLASTILRC